MSLPLPSIPRTRFEYIRPDNKEKVQMYALTAGLEQSLLQTKDGDPEARAQALQQVIHDCSAGALDASVLPLFVVEDLFIRLREVSMGEKQDMVFLCKSMVEQPDDENGQKRPPKQCNAEINYTLEYKSVKVIEQEGHQMTFRLSEDVGFKMRYPSLGDYKLIDKNSSENRAIALCITQIFQGDEVWESSDVSLDDREAWVSSLSPLQRREVLEKAVEKAPKIGIDMSFTCPKCKAKHNMKARGLAQLFK